jgi:signal transduction histidine kinase
MSTLDFITELGKDVPIKKKLLLIVLIITSLAMLFMSSAVVFYDRQAAKSTMIQELNVLTRIVAHRSTAALAFDDKQLANENLQALSEKNIIIFACIYDDKKQLFGSYKTGVSQCPDKAENISVGFKDDYYEAREDITLDNSLVGSISVRASLENINQRLVKYIEVVFLIFIITGILSFILAIKLQKIITRPIDELSEVSRKIFLNKDYSVRVDKSTNDEVGRLVEAFNNMLSSVEERDLALVDAKDNLEDLVKERTNKLKEAQKDLVRSERMATLGQLTATVSHELRNPLGTIRTSVFTLSNKLKDKDVNLKKTIDRIERNIIRCDNIITELLDYSRIRALQHEKTNLSLWIQTVLSDMNIPESINLKLDLNKEIDIELDKDLFHRVLINVIENGCQAIEEKTADKSDRTLIIQCLLSNERTEVVIIDTGTGIPDDIFPHIFEPLYSTKGFGVGLGLAVVQQIMQQHGGGVEISSEKDVGTKVTLWLPLSLNMGKRIAS